jgi:multidrug resistance efflux pump
MLELLKESGPIIQIVFGFIMLAGFSWLAKRYVKSWDAALNDLKTSITKLSEDIAVNRADRVRALDAQGDRIRSLEEQNAKQQGSLSQGQSRFDRLENTLARAETKADAALMGKTSSEDCEARRALIQRQFEQQEKCIDKCTSTVEGMRQELTKGLASIDSSMRILRGYLEEKIVIGNPKGGE